MVLVEKKALGTKMGITYEELQQMSLDGNIHIPFPIIFTSSDGKKMEVNEVTEEETRDVYNFVQIIVNKFEAYLKSEYPLDYISKLIENGVAYSLKSQATGELVGVMMSIPSPVCRSTKPLTGAGFFATTIQGKGIGGILGNIRIVLEVKAGFYGLTSRTAVVNRKMIKLVQKNFKGMLLGVVPRSMWFDKMGWVDDAITFVDFGELLQKQNAPTVTEAARLKQVPLPVPPSMNAIAPDTWDVHVGHTDILLPNMPTIQVHKANLVEKHAAEMLFHEAAMKGDGFALDEFTPEGYLNRRLFKKSTTLVAKSGNDVIASMIIGPAGFCRVQNPCFLNMQLVVKTEFQGKGIGDGLLNLAFRYGKAWEFEGFLVDCFMTENHAIHLLQKYGFQPTGSVPFSGYLRNKGFKTTLLLFCKIQHFHKNAKL